VDAKLYVKLHGFSEDLKPVSYENIRKAKEARHPAANSFLLKKVKKKKEGAVSVLRSRTAPPPPPHLL
jgi:hypothetical protein